MKCEICDQEGLRWWQKIFLALSLPMKCRNCDARYHLRLFDPPLTQREQSFYGFLGHLLAPLFFIALLTIFFWLLDMFIWPVVVFILLVFWIGLCLIVPHRINPKDPVNAIIQRIQTKKQPSVSTDVDPNT